MLFKIKLKNVRMLLVTLAILSALGRYTPAQAAPVAEVKPVKAYSFKSSVAMGSLVSDAPKVNTAGSAGAGARPVRFGRSQHRGLRIDGGPRGCNGLK